LPNYEIVAVANSSIESSNRSIQHHGLPPSIKAYGSALDIAKDPDVDLIVVSVNVREHFALTKPAIENGKDVFVEWPLGASVAEAKELTEFAAAQGVKTSVGLQIRVDPLIQKLKEVISSGKIGKVINSSALLSTNISPADGWPKGMEFYLDLQSGGNQFTITFGHCKCALGMDYQLTIVTNYSKLDLDAFTHVLGDFTQVQGLLKSQYPTVPVLDSVTGQVVEKAHPKTSPDNILIQGILENGATASIALRTSKSAVDGMKFRWIITGTEGEIEYLIPEAAPYKANQQLSFKVKLNNAQTIEEIEMTAVNSPAANVPFPGTGTARLYENFASEDGEVVSFESALKTQQLLEKIAKTSGFDI
jgi:predicted dehydrogenase